MPTSGASSAREASRYHPLPSRPARDLSPRPTALRPPATHSHAAVRAQDRRVDPCPDAASFWNDATTNRPCWMTEPVCSFGDTLPLIGCPCVRSVPPDGLAVSGQGSPSRTGHDDVRTRSRTGRCRPAGRKSSDLPRRSSPTWSGMSLPGLGRSSRPRRELVSRQRSVAVAIMSIMAGRTRPD